MFNTAARGGSSWGLSPLQRTGLRAVTALAVTGAITAPLVGIATAQTGSLGSSGSGGSTPPASSTTPTTPPTTTTPPPATVQATVELRVLVLDDGDFSGEAFATRLAAEGVEVDRINVRAPGRRAITRAMLADDATKTARYMGIVSVAADRTGLTPAENAVIDQFTADYGIREVSANVTPVADVGLVPTTSGTNFDATTATLTADAVAGEWSYLDGPVRFENLSPTVAESWGYAATPAAGAQFEPLLTGPSGGGAGVMMGIHTQGTRERLVMTVAMNQYQHHFKALSHGIITWLTRGVSTSLYRNVFNVQVDDVFLADDEWNPAGNCTFGVNCVGEPAPGALTESRMVAGDVAAVTSWENANGIELDMTFNAFGARVGDGLTDALLAAKDQLRWINHTWDHTNLDDLGQAAITAQIRQNIAWARDNGVPLDPTELVTGQHSGTASGPARIDNPALGPALGETGVTWIAGDASVEPNQRRLGDALTVPRHPMNIYYNTSTKANAVDEYNWIYTSAAQGGSGICETNAGSTCLPAPLPLETGFDDYIVPQEARHALSHALSMDPRPHYAHQSNITGDRILYPVLQTMVDDYYALFNDQSAPLANPSHAALGREMQRRAAWADAADSVTATVRGSTLVIENSGVASVEVPVTTRSGSTFNGETYAGAKSAWVAVPSGGEITIELGDDVGFLTPDEDSEEPAVAARALPQSARAAMSPSPAQNSVVIPPINDATRVGAIGEGPSARG